MPGGQDEQNVVVGRLLNIPDASEIRGNAEHAFEVRYILIAGDGASQFSIFRFGESEPAGNNAGFFKQQSVEFRQMDGGPGFIGIC